MVLLLILPRNGDAEKSDGDLTVRWILRIENILIYNASGERRVCSNRPECRLMGGGNFVGWRASSLVVSLGKALNGIASTFEW